MTTTRNDYDPKAYNPTFQWHFLAPKYWGTWLTVLVVLPFAFLPHSARLWISSKLVGFLVKKMKGTIYKAWVNLYLCFPEKSVQERKNVLTRCLSSAGAFLLGFASITLRNKKWLQQNCVLTGLDNITSLTDSGQKIILLVPHTWAIDVPAILLASKGLPVSAMAKKQSNEVMDWLMHKQRVQYGGRVYERSNGIKPFIKSVRDGYLGYYLPDQDHGAEHSVFVDFFATTKATLPGLGKLSKVSRAKIVPVYSMYNADTGKYEIDIYPALDTFPTGTDDGDARAMNAFIEKCVTERPEQYMWILQLLRTQKNGQNVYKDKNLRREIL